MNDFNGTNDERIAFVDGETDEKLTAEEKRNLNTARAFLGGVTPEKGMRLAIYRLHPGWIPGGTGWLETADYLDVSESILEYIRECYGGGSFVLKVLDHKGRYLAAQNFKIAGDPKYRGRTITQLEAEAMVRPVGPPPTPPTTPPESEALKFFMQNASDSQRDTMKLLLQMWGNQKPANGPTAMEDFIKMMKLVKEMQESTAPAATADESAGALSGIVALVTQFMQNQQQQTQQRAQMTQQPMPAMVRPAKHFFANPPAEMKKNPAPLPNLERNEPQKTETDIIYKHNEPLDSGCEGDVDDDNKTIDDNDDETDEDLAAEIASYPIEDIVALVSDVFKNMDPEKTAEVLKRMSAG
jgi:hypothetical protein